jgi:exodeoxyribonuclease VII small subunit
MTHPPGPRDPSSPKPTSFEDHLEAIEAAIRRLESGDIPLEDSIDLYARAMAHLKACHVVLGEAEKRLELVRRAGDAPFAPAAPAGNAAPSPAAARPVVGTHHAAPAEVDDDGVRPRT